MIFDNSIFVPETELESFCARSYGPDKVHKLKYLLSAGLLPVYSYNDANVVIKEDLTVLLDMLMQGGDSISNPIQKNLFTFEEQHAIKLGSHTTVDLACEDCSSDSTLFSAIPNLIRFCKDLSQLHSQEESIHYFSGARLTTTSQAVLNYAQAQISRSELADMMTVSQFAGSAYYMGSKRQLCGFLTEAISSILPESGVVIDLMCGSGVASGAFSNIWRTFASDAQAFCQILAVVHGGGFTRRSAEALLKQIIPVATVHFGSLQQKISEHLEVEENLFCSDLSESLINEYSAFVESFPTISNNKKSRSWHPQEEVDLRKLNPSSYPYCLFTTYFANTYFGIRQSAEIDSIRYAIDQLNTDLEKKWALGALIATLSALGTTYGHFAQPAVVNFETMTLEKLSKVITKRSFSITHEFSVRLLNLAEKSEGSHQAVDVLPGPWPIALAEAGQRLDNERVVVYVDAPYTREEYSRFYHVLETLVQYSYPSCTGKGLTPKPGDRFRSDFFTKTQSKMESILVTIIKAILDKGWSCAWSYADTGTAGICEVLKQVHAQKSCTIKSYSVPFLHKSQGGHRPKTVTEYLILFSPT